MTRKGTQGQILEQQMGQKVFADAYKKTIGFFAAGNTALFLFGGFVLFLVWLDWEAGSFSEFESRVFTSALYLYSSFLQADAAILGIGAVFVVYKLQSLDTMFSNTASWLERNDDTRADARKYFLATKPEDKANAFVNYGEGTLYYNQFERLETIPVRVVLIQGGIRTPIVVIATHIVLCSVLLFVAPNTIHENTIWNLLLLTSVGLFILGVALTTGMAVRIIGDRDKLTLRTANPQLYETVLREREKRSKLPHLRA